MLRTLYKALPERKTSAGKYIVNTSNDKCFSIIYIKSNCSYFELVSDLV